MARKLPSPLAPPAAVPAASRAVHGEQEVTTDSARLKLSPQARARLEQQARVMADVRDFAEKYPEEAGKLLRVWLSKGKG